MAGYFQYLGRVFTEKGSWYKILTIVVLQSLLVYFTPNDLAQDFANGAGFVPNIPALLLYLLVSSLIFGFSIQIYTNSLNDSRNLLPNIDFLGMFVSALRFVPFSIVWGLYIIIFSIIFAFLVTSFRSWMFLPFIPMILFLILMFITMPVIMALHAKQFSYKHVLNPFLPFLIFSRVAAPVALLDLILALLSSILYVFIFLGGILVGISGNAGAHSGAEISSGGMSYASLIFLLVVGFYVQNAIAFAYSLRLCDIIKDRLADTEYLDDEFDSLNNVDDE